MPLNIHTFKSKNNGPHVLVTAAVHGSELCGTKGSEYWIDLLESEPGLLNSGTVTFVPRVNPIAFERGVRSVNVNMNRIIGRYSHDALKDKTYEYKLAHELAGIIDDVDVVLDLHSSSSKTAPFVFQDSDHERNQSLATITCRTHNLQSILVGWNAYFLSDDEEQKSDDEFGSIQAYALSQDKAVITLECGQHDDPASVEVAKGAIGHVLVGYNHIDSGVLAEQGVDTNTTPPHRYRLIGHAVEKADGEYTKDWSGFDFVPKGTVMARYDTGEEILADQDCYMIMPSTNTYSPEGNDDNWFYWAEKVSS